MELVLAYIGPVGHRTDKFCNSGGSNEQHPVHDSGAG